MTNLTVTSPLPLKHDLTTARTWSIILAALIGVMSLAGLIFPEVIYPTEELSQSYLANDVVNLLIGLPILLGSIWLARRGALLGLLFWPGALLYSLYNYTAYLFGIPFGWITGVNLTIVLLSGYLMFVLLKEIDGKWVQEQVAGKVPEKFGGWVLVLFGIAFILRSIGEFASGSMPITEIGVLVADLALSAAMFSGGVSMLWRKPFGYASSTGLLFAASMLFIGLILVLLLQPVLTDAPFDLAGVLTVAVMSVVCFLPFVLFVRGIQKERKS